MADETKKNSVEKLVERTGRGMNDPVTFADLSAWENEDERERVVQERDAKKAADNGQGSAPSSTV